MSASHEISGEAFARLSVLLNERRQVERSRKLSKARNARRPLSLAQKLEADSKYKTKLAEINDEIDQLTKGAAA